MGNKVVQSPRSRALCVPGTRVVRPLIQDHRARNLVRTSKTTTEEAMTCFKYHRQRLAERRAQGVPEPATLEETVDRFNADAVAYYVQHPAASIRGELTRSGRRAVRYARRPFFAARRTSRATRRASRRTLRRSAHGPPGRRSSDDDPEPPPPPLGRRRHALARLRLLVDAYIWPSRVWKRIARTLERERGQ